MFSHTEIWVAIDRLADSSGYSTSGLAKKAGLDATAFNRSKRMSPEGKPRWPSTESLAKILSVTNVTMYEFISLIKLESLSNPHSLPHQHTRTIPVINSARAAAEGIFNDSGYPIGEDWDDVELQGMLPTEQGTYAIEISDNSMEPLYRKGDLAVISPTATIRRGDRIVVKTTDGNLVIRELARQTTSKIELKPLNPSHDNVAFDMTSVDWIARVLWVSQ
jgi:phage repressor protein C with HTH and peptisase S24 domain